MAKPPRAALHGSEELGRIREADACESALVVPAGLREALVAILEAGGEQVEAHGDIDALLESNRRNPPTAILLWLERLALDLRATVAPLLASFATTPLIAICDDGERRGVRAALAVGFSGVVEREQIERALVPCLRAVRAGQVCVPRAHWRQIEPPVLSTREKQILGLVVMGYMNGEIAERLYLAESTVKSHLSSAFAKLGVRSRNEAVAVILDPERGLGTGILGLGGQPMETIETPA